MRNLVIGHTGQLGNELMRLLPAADTVGIDEKTLDLCDHEAVRRRILSDRPGRLYNCAAFVAVDKCESEEGGQAAWRLNAHAVGNLAAACAAAGARLIHISTDYVFDGAKAQPYVESDAPNPLSTYGKTKLAGEHAALACDPRALVVRTCGLYGIRSWERGGGAFVEAILSRAEAGGSLRVVADQLVSPTWCADLARGLVELADRGATGVVHLVNAGGTTWHGLASAAVRLAGLQVPVEPIPAADWKAPARRAPDSRLASERLEELGVAALRPWEEALAAYIAERAARKAGRDQAKRNH